MGQDIWRTNWFMGMVPKMFCRVDKREPSSPEDKAEYGIFILLYLLSGFKRWITDVKLEKTGIDENCIEQISVVKIAVDVPSEREMRKKKRRDEHVQQ